MSRDSDEFPGGSRGTSRPTPPGAQGASRGGFRPDDSDGNFDADDAYTRPTNPNFGATNGGNPFGNKRPGGGWRSFFGGGPHFLGLPVNLIYTLGAMLIGIVFLGAVCGRPTATGTVAGQVKGLNADKTLTTLAGAQLVLRGSGQTYSATSSNVPPDAEGEAAYNYRFESVPAGNYVMSVTPPSGSSYQSEDSITVKVEGGELFPQSVMLLAQGIQKPRALTANELRDGEAGGYVNERGERVVYQNGGFDASDALLMYLLWRNPPGFGYYSPPIIYSPGGSSTSSYRVADPPSSTRSGQTITQQRPVTQGQGSTRPSGSTGVTGAGPNTSSGSSSSSRPSDAVAPSQSNPSSGSSSSGSNTSTQTQTRPSVSAPSQGVTRPSSSSSSPSRSSAPSRSSGSSSGGRR